MRVSDDIFLGAAFGPSLPDSNPAPMEAGVGPMGRVYIFDVVPLTLQTAGVAALQTLGAAGNMTLAAGTGVTTSVDATGTTRYVLDTPRCVTLTSAGNISAVTFTITGYDLYGQPMTQTLAGPNANTVATTKAFKSVIRIAASAAVATNTSAGFNDKLGIPVRVTDVGYITSVKWAGTLAADAGTFVAADTTDPATASTTDVRGCYTPSSASNGTRRLVMSIALPSLAVGPQSTRAGAFGVTQV
jgi:VCBS repeat-containing protein